MTKISEKALNNKSMPWWTEKIYGTELLGMRLLRKKSIKEMVRVTGEDENTLSMFEKDQDNPVPPPIAGCYMMYLSCGMHDIYQFRNIVNGKAKSFQQERSISTKLKREVYEKCHSRCVICHSTHNLHIHHIKEFAKGGLSNIENLVLLCASCHAKTHKGNPAYYLLKSEADRE